MSYNFEQLDLKILKHFERINKNIYIEKDSKEWKTISTMRNVVARYRTENPMPFDFGCYDTKEFLNLYWQFTEPKLTADDDKIYITQDNEVATYYQSDPSVLVSPKFTPTVPETNFECEFKTDDLLFIEKFSNILKSPDVVIYSNKGEVYLRVCDKKNLTTNLVNRKLNAKTNKQFIYFMKPILFSGLLRSEYKVKFADKAVELTNHYIDLTYWIVSEPHSIADDLPKHKYPIDLDLYWN